MDFAAFVMVPANGNFAQTQSRLMREIEQLDVECEPDDLRGFKNGTTNFKTKSLETSLRVPKRQAGGKPHQQVENATALFAPPWLMMTD